MEMSPEKQTKGEDRSPAQFSIAMTIAGIFH